MAQRDLYAVLGVQSGVSDDELRRTYRKLARQFHPDVNAGNKAAEERFKEISAAYEVLSSPQKRKLYDEFGEAGLREGFDAEQARAYQSWSQQRAAGAERSGPGGFSFDFGDLGDILGERFGGRRGPRGPVPLRGADLLAEVEIDLAEALAGTEITLENGLTVRIPKGADDGSRLRVQGRGAPGRNGGPPGDLVIETRVRPHPFFRREGLDLYLRLPVTLHEAHAGTQIEVPTPTGSVKLKIPSLSQQGAELRLRKKGVERGRRRGDLYVQLDVRLPERDSPSVRQGIEMTQEGYAKPVREGLRL